MSLAITERFSLWRIQEYNGRPDTARILEDIYDNQLTGRVLLHVKSGRIISVELCTRYEFERAEIPSLPDILEYESVT